MDFALMLQQNIQQVQEAINDEVINTFIQFANKAVDYSPLQDDAIYPGVYAKGLFANSWYVAINEFDESVGTIPDESANSSRARINSLKSVKSFKFKDGYISLTNNLSYAANVEYLGWTITGPYAPLRHAVTLIMGAKKI